MASGSSDRLDAVRHLVSEVLAAVDPDLTLYDIEISGTAGSAMLRILVDHTGGVDLDTLTDTTRALEAAFEQDADLRTRYALEVSSPGLERPLRTPEHFAAAVGATVSVKTFAPLDGNRRFDGTLTEADSDGCVVETEGTSHRLAYDAIAKARTTFEWKRGRKSGGDRQRQKAARS